MKNLISIIVPVYNVEKYLSQCIESIINQTYKNIEIILVDDESPDLSGVICDEYKEKDNRIIVIHQNNKGLVSTRKAGLKICKGEYIGFVDGDDYIELNMYEKLYKAIQDSNADVVHSGYFKNGNKEIWGVQTDAILELSRVGKSNAIVELILSEQSKSWIAPSIWSKLFSRKTIMRAYMEVPDYLSYGEDLVCLLNSILECNKLAIINQAFYHYIKREGSITNLVKNDLLMREINLYNEMKKIMGNYLLYEDMQEKMEFSLIKKIAFALKQVNAKSIQCYCFPDMKILYDKKIVIYGAGMVGQDYYTQIKSYEHCEIIAWIDRMFDKYSFEYYKVQPVEILERIDFDIIVIAVSNGQMAKKIRNDLIELGVQSDKILWKMPEFTMEVKCN